jgi:UDP-N-acetylglucosamine:LPS N-acetylglucosamine transferase
VEEKTLTEGTLTARVKSLLDDPAGRADMERRIRDFACPDANEQIYARLTGFLKM